MLDEPCFLSIEGMSMIIQRLKLCLIKIHFPNQKSKKTMLIEKTTFSHMHES